MNLRNKTTINCKFICNQISQLYIKQRNKFYDEIGKNTTKKKEPNLSIHTRRLAALSAFIIFLISLAYYYSFPPAVNFLNALIPIALAKAMALTANILAVVFCISSFAYKCDLLVNDFTEFQQKKMVTHYWSYRDKYKPLRFRFFGQLIYLTFLQFWLFILASLKGKTISEYLAFLSTYKNAGYSSEHNPKKLIPEPSFYKIVNSSDVQLYNDDGSVTYKAQIFFGNGKFQIGDEKRKLRLFTEDKRGNITSTTDANETNIYRVFRREKEKIWAYNKSLWKKLYIRVKVLMNRK